MSKVPFIFRKKKEAQKGRNIINMSMKSMKNIEQRGFRENPMEKPLSLIRLVSPFQQKGMFGEAL